MSSRVILAGAVEWALIGGAVGGTVGLVTWLFRKRSQAAAKKLAPRRAAAAARPAEPPAEARRVSMAKEVLIMLSGGLVGVALMVLVVAVSLAADTKPHIVALPVLGVLWTVVAGAAFLGRVGTKRCPGCGRNTRHYYRDKGLTLSCPRCGRSWPV